jgi:hypothetical protein
LDHYVALDGRSLRLQFDDVEHAQRLELSAHFVALGARVLQFFQ